MQARKDAAPAARPPVEYSCPAAASGGWCCFTSALKRLEVTRPLVDRCRPLGLRYRIDQSRTIGETA
jgi:cell division septation protein DedD